MIRSMTGYGRGRAAAGPIALTAQVRSVNTRGREIRLRLPHELYELEEALRQLVQESAARGRIDVVLDWDGAPPAAARHSVNVVAAEAMIAAWRALRAAHDLPDEPTTEALLRLPGVVEPLPQAAPDVDALHRSAREAVVGALAAHRAAREREGQRLAADIAARSRTIARLVDECAALLEGTMTRAAVALRERVTQLLGEVPVDEQRLAQEIALAAQRADVTEELVRLRAHFGRLFALFEPQAEEIGRTLEFLVQEIRREVNTLAAKTGGPEIDERTLAVRAELERIREQAANLE